MSDNCCHCKYLQPNSQAPAAARQLFSLGSPASAVPRPPRIQKGLRLTLVGVPYAGARSAPGLRNGVPTNAAQAQTEPGCSLTGYPQSPARIVAARFGSTNCAVLQVRAAAPAFLKKRFHGFAHAFVLKDDGGPCGTRDHRIEQREHAAFAIEDGEFHG